MEYVKSYLLDTHTFLWAVSEDKKLGKKAYKIIENKNSRLYISAISAFEVANKHRLGKLPEYEQVIENYKEIADKLGVIELPITTSHALFAAKFDWKHRDPFDRILASQSSLENMILITNDSAFSELSWVKKLW